MIGAVIRAGIVSRSAAVRAGLRALLDGAIVRVEVESPSLADLEAHHLDVIVTDDAGLEAWSGNTSGTASRNALGGAIVLLSDDASLISRLMQLEPSGWALVSTDAPADELRAAITAAAHGLAALPVGLLDQRWLEASNDAVNDAVLNGTDLEPGINPEALSQELTARERDVLELLSLGLPNKTIARRLTIGESTVKFHLAAIYAKLGVSSRTAAVSAAARRGWVTI